VCKALAQHFLLNSLTGTGASELAEYSHTLLIISRATALPDNQLNIKNLL